MKSLPNCGEESERKCNIQGVNASTFFEKICSRAQGIVVMSNVIRMS